MAKLECKLKGMELVSIESAEEQDAIAKELGASFYFYKIKFSVMLFFNSNYKKPFIPLMLSTFGRLEILMEWIWNIMLFFGTPPAACTDNIPTGELTNQMEEIA